ncbi:hypothetical protein [Parapedobacter sp. 10938]|uniref:hypothetical protein n=1 Tax=Parapedobacter flavus TaxID=3110225 RepID=UPI002DBD96AF|nr:hypothetical protein [Parapedobacter sp. 10938]MEC3881273.1 hypothetical protein [Parapedobacter sp. 10938]
MRRLSLFILLCVAFPYLGFSQFGNESPVPYFRYSVTAGMGANQLYGDLDKRQIGGGVFLRGNYFLTHGVSIGLELQEGLLRGRDSIATDEVVRKATNLYHAAILGVRFQPIKFLQDDHQRRIEYRESVIKRTLNSVYVGAGIGVLHSLQWDKQRAVGQVETTDPITGDSVLVESVLPAHKGRSHGFTYIVSTNVGFEIPLHSLKPNLLDSYVWNLVVNGQLNFALDDELDGYSGDYAGNKHQDIYAMLTLGVNLRF